MIRPAYPDELSRARAFAQGAAVPASAQFLVAVVEHPVERLIAVFPYWPKPTSTDEDEKQTTYEFAFYFGPSSTDQEKLLDASLSALESTASDAGATYLRCQTPFPEDHPLYEKLTGLGYEIAQTDRHLSMPGDAVVSRSKGVYEKIKHRIPAHWKVQSIRGHNPEAIYQIVSEHQLMSAHQFKGYWDSSNKEHFEQDYSCVILDGEEIIATFLHTLRGNDELHIHVDAIATAHKHLSGPATVAMRNWIASNCPNGFPKTFTCRADSQLHLQTGNTALRQGGEELPHQHFLCKSLSRSD